MKCRILINYRRADSLGSAGRLYDRLSNHFTPEQVFMDVDTIEPGVDFVQAIEEAVSSCNVFIAVIGPDWLTFENEKGQRRIDDPEDFVRLEIVAALKRDILVIPVLVEGATMPQLSDLPPALKPLAHRNAIEISHTRFDLDAKRLIQAIEHASKQIKKERNRKQHISPPRKKILIFLGTLLVAFIGYLGIRAQIPISTAPTITPSPTITPLVAYIVLYKDDTFSGASLRIDLDDCGRVDIKRDSALYDSTSSFILVAPKNVEIVLVQNLTSDGHTGNTGRWQGNNESLQVNIDELKDLGVHDNVSSIQWLVDGKLLNDSICQVD